MNLSYEGKLTLDRLEKEILKLISNSKNDDLLKDE
jgi:hypothetical protein